MKIVALGDWHNYNSHFLHGVVEGSIQNGWHAMGVDYINVDLLKVKKTISDYDPDYIFCHMLFSDQGNKRAEKMGMVQEIKKKGRTRIYYHMADPRIIPRCDEDISGVVNGVLIGGMDWDGFQNWKVPLYYWPYGCFQQDKVEERECRFDLVFTGNLSGGYLYQDRTIFLKKLIKEWKKLTVIPNKNYHKNTTFSTDELASITRAVINICGRHDINMYFSIRPFQYIGAGAFCINKYSKGIETVFTDKIHHVVFNEFDMKEVVDLYKYYVETCPDQRNKIRMAGFEYCQKNHTYRVRMKDIMDVFTGKRKRVRYLLEDFR